MVIKKKFNKTLKKEINDVAKLIRGNPFQSVFIIGKEVLKMPYFKKNKNFLKKLTRKRKKTKRRHRKRTGRKK